MPQLQVTCKAQKSKNYLGSTGVTTNLLVEGVGMVLCFGHSGMPIVFFNSPAFVILVFKKNLQLDQKV